MSSLPWKDIRRILVIRCGGIGEIIMAGPVLRALRGAIKNLRITLMASPAGAQAAPLLPWIDEVLVHRAAWEDESSGLVTAQKEREFVADISAGRFDAAVILTGHGQSPYPAGYACYLSGIPLRIGLSKESGGNVLTHAVPPPADTYHQIDRNLFLIEAAGLRSPVRRTELSIPRRAAADADALLERSGIAPDAPFIVLAPGARDSSRRYEPARFAEAAATVSAEAKLPVVIVASVPSAATAAHRSGRRSASFVSLAGMTSVEELAALLRRARLVLCNDAAPMYLADALERPMVVLFSGMALPRQRGQRNSTARILSVPVDCAPCSLDRCPQRRECLDIAPAEVAREALRLLESGTRLPVPLRAGGEA